MLRLGRMIADGLTIVTIGVGVATTGAGYAHSISDPIAQVDEAAPAWMDPETTGAIKPKPADSSARSETSQPELRAGSAPWVDPPRRPKTGDWSASALGQTMELRLPRP